MAHLTTYPASPKPHFPVEETAEFRTVISELEGKMEQRRKKWSTQRRRWRLAYKTLTATEMDTLWNFYLARGGAFEAFNFVNPNDQQTYVVRFLRDQLSKERFAAALYNTGLELIETNAPPEP